MGRASGRVGAMGEVKYVVDRVQLMAWLTSSCESQNVALSITDTRTIENVGRLLGSRSELPAAA
jgi:hypothetical protein